MKSAFWLLAVTSIGLIAVTWSLWFTDPTAWEGLTIGVPIAITCALLIGAGTTGVLVRQ